MRTRRSIFITGGLFAAAGWPALGALAQPYGDSGEFVILEARYGTRRRNVDVTDRLRQVARSDRPAQVGNDLFGVDPAFGEVKILRIYARGRDGATHIFEIREGDFIDGAQFSGWRGGRWGERDGWRGGWGGDPGRQPHRGALVIHSARYGDGRQLADVTERLRMLARNGRLDVEVSNESMGIDPAFGRQKSLYVMYSVGGPRLEARVPEHGRLVLP